ncbi:hypothetical protein V494_06345 [Pseudogymnoascus sp. VKM F-4513 (FW-928)]|nr:hypothetical protein V494_06345 [Pseudogymnoascus sp. VKM F-4513 (FW-928)]
MSGVGSSWSGPRSPHQSPHTYRGGGRPHYRGGGRGSYSYNRDRVQEDRDERERERRAVEAAKYRRDNGKSRSRETSEHGSRVPLPKAQDSTPSTPVGSGLGDEFASAILSLTEWAQEKQYLRLRRERARHDYDDAKSIYESGKPTHAQFPIEGERAKERYAKEKLALEALEARSKEADTKISTSKAAVAHLYNALSKGAEDKTKDDYREQVATMNSSLLNNADSLVSLSQDILELKKHQGYNKNQLVQQQDQIRDIRASIKGRGGMPFQGQSNDAPSPIDDVTLLRIQSMETRLAAEQSSNQQLTSRVETIEQAQAKNMSAVQQEIQLSIAKTSNLKLEPRVDAIERGQANMLMIQQNFEQIQGNVSDFDDDLHTHDERIKALESSSHDPQLPDTTEPKLPPTSFASLSAGDTSLITQRIDAFENTVNTNITEIKESQDASDIAHGAVIQGLNENISKVESMVSELAKNIEALQAQQRATSDDQRQLLRRVGSLESDFVHMKPVKTVMPSNGNGNGAESSASASPTGSLQNGVPKSTYDWGPVLNTLRSEVADINRRLAETKQFEAGINMGIRNLDTRMNNIFTDNVCKQMIGQLQAIYPNVARVEGHLADLKSRMGLVESIFQDHTASIGYIKDAQDSIQGRQQAGDDKFRTEIANLSTAIDSIRASISTIQSQENASQKPSLSNEQDTSLKVEMTERIDLLSESFKKQIEAASKRLEAQIEGIEHLIEFDDDGKVQSVKEVIHVLTENYGKMMGEFDALEHQVRQLKTGASSRRVSAVNSPAISRMQDGAQSPSKAADSPALTSTAPFRIKQPGSKRSAPPSPSTTASAQVHGQQQTKKRKGNGFGAFISEDDE